MIRLIKTSVPVIQAGLAGGFGEQPFFYDSSRVIVFTTLFILSLIRFHTYFVTQES